MNPKLKEELIDLAHLVHQAVIADDDRVAEAALADLRASLGAEKVVGCGFGVVGSTNNTQLTTRNPFLTVAPGVKLVRFAGKDRVQLLAKVPAKSGTPPTVFKVDVDKVGMTAAVFRDSRFLFSVNGVECANASMIEQLAVSALHRYLKRCRYRTLRRYRARKAKK